MVTDAPALRAITPYPLNASERAYRLALQAIPSAEEDPQYALRPRLDLHGADAARIYTMRGTTGKDGKPRWANIATDIPQLRAVIAAYGIGVVFIDPISSYLPGTDRNAEGDMRDALSGLQTLMEETGVAVVGIAHVGKGEGRGRRIEQRLMGSTAFVALARTVWMLNRLPDEHQPESTPDNPQSPRLVFGVAKANYAMKPQSLMLTRPLDGPLQWLGPSPVSIEASFETSDKGTVSQGAEAWLRAYLTDGPKLSRDVDTAARGAGFSQNAIRTARASLDVKSRKLPTGEWEMTLPKNIMEGAGTPQGDTHTNTLHNVDDSKAGKEWNTPIFPEQWAFSAIAPENGHAGNDPESVDIMEGWGFPVYTQTPAFHNEHENGPLPPTGTDEDGRAY